MALPASAHVIMYGAGYDDGGVQQAETDQVQPRLALAEANARVPGSGPPLMPLQPIARAEREEQVTPRTLKVRAISKENRQLDYKGPYFTLCKPGAERMKKEIKRRFPDARSDNWPVGKCLQVLSDSSPPPDPVAAILDHGRFVIR